MYMLHKLRQLGFSARVFEAGEDVGGTWYWNRYPGARCDVESVEYCYEFSQELVEQWDWSERYAPQAEILDYANHVADRFDLRRDIEFSRRIRSAHFDEHTSRWTLTTTSGDQYEAQYCIFATGCLSVPIKPDLAGLDDFTGDVYFTGEWPHDPVDFSGKRVGVIGTGSSGIQSIPVIAEQAQELVVFQRSANYTVPARNEPLQSAVLNAVRAEYPAFRQRSRDSGFIFGACLPHNEGFAGTMTESEQLSALEQFWEYGGLFFLRAFGDSQTDEGTNQIIQNFVQNKTRQQIDDPAVAELLCPDGLIGCKRLCADTGYYQTFNRDSVSLVDIKAEPIERLTENSLQTTANSYPLDALVFATGFDAMTGALERIDIRGIAGQTLNDQWRDGPKTLMGLQSAGFPNLFIITGPGSPSVLSNMLQSIEQNVEWIADLLKWTQANGYNLVQAQPEAQADWMEQVATAVEPTLYPRCNSWYRGANIDGKPQVFSPYVGYMEYVEHCNEVAASGYPGFTIR